ncbi:porin [Paraburkholderia terrae]|uniref:porin n=1 Tax=Paraburkholderia terrae TaxID=311230 RepID=UPI0005A66766|nr:porin [Paraburkholderia terrae]
MKGYIALSLICISTGAAAQSSFTLWGRLDAGVQYLTNVAGQNGKRSNVWSADSGDAGASAWGMTGVEYIGNGYKVNFKLLDYFQVTNGVAWNPFWENAYVGISGPFGSFRLGQDDSIIKDGNYEFDPFSQQDIGLASLVRNANWPNFSNTISYYSPSFKGFDVAFQYSLNGVPGNFNSGRTAGVQLTYRLGGFSARTIYQEVRDANGKFSDLYAAQKQVFVGAMYNVNHFKVQATYTYMAAPDAPQNRPRYADYGWFGVTYSATGPFTAMAAVYHIHQRDGQGSATLLNLGSTYSLSKRTYLYATVGYLINGEHTNFSATAQPPDSPYNPPIGHNQLGFFTGIMHYF